MSHNEMNLVRFERIEGIPEMPETEELKPYLTYKDKYNNHWAELLYDKGYNVDIKSDFIAYQKEIGNDYDGMAGLFFNIQSNVEPVLMNLLTSYGFKFTGESKDALMIHYNGADDYLIDLGCWQDILDWKN